MQIQRDRYLNKLIQKRENGMVKVITGIRRCGKSYLLYELYHQYLNAIGVSDDQIIELALDEDENIRYRNPLELGQYIRSLLTDKTKMYYVFLDEIQKVADIPNPYLPGTDEKIGFVDVLLGLMKIKNVDLYVTGSNSKMLSTDILTEFRGRGDEVRINPLSYAEFYAAYGEVNVVCHYLREKLSSVMLKTVLISSHRHLSSAVNTPTVIHQIILLSVLFPISK